MSITPLYAVTPLPGYGVGSPTTADPPVTSYQWVVAWVVVILLAAMVSQTESGYTAIYYGLVLILVLLLVTQYKFIATALAPIGQTLPARG